MNNHNNEAERQAYQEFFSDFERIALFALLKVANTKDPSLLPSIETMWYERNLASIETQMSQMAAMGMSEEECDSIKYTVRNILDECRDTINQITCNL